MSINSNINVSELKSAMLNEEADLVVKCLQKIRHPKLESYCNGICNVLIASQIENEGKGEEYREIAHAIIAEEAKLVLKCIRSLKGESKSKDIQEVTELIDDYIGEN